MAMVYSTIYYIPMYLILPVIVPEIEFWANKTKLSATLPMLELNTVAVAINPDFINCPVEVNPLITYWLVLLTPVVHNSTILLVSEVIML